MKIGYGISRHVDDFAKAGLDTFAPPNKDAPREPRAWVDTDKRVRPEMTEMLMSLTAGDVVFVVSMADLGKGAAQVENVRRIEAAGATVKVIPFDGEPPAPRKPGPKPKWPDIDAKTLKDGAAKWRNPNLHTHWAALKVFHDAGFTWVTRHTLHDNLGPRSAPKAKETDRG